MKHTKIAWMALLPLVWACDSKPADETATKETVVVEDASAVADNTLTEEEKASGWKLLFDGTNTDGWREFNGENFPEEGWTVEDGALKALGKGGDPAGSLCADDQFGGDIHHTYIGHRADLLRRQNIVQHRRMGVFAR